MAPTGSLYGKDKQFISGPDCKECEDEWIWILICNRGKTTTITRIRSSEALLKYMIPFHTS